jgi:hypothetical protein
MAQSQYRYFWSQAKERAKAMILLLEVMTAWDASLIK